MREFVENTVQLIDAFRTVASGEVAAIENGIAENFDVSLIFGSYDLESAPVYLAGRVETLMDALQKKARVVSCSPLEGSSGKGIAVNLKLEKPFRQDEAGIHVRDSAFLRLAYSLGVTSLRLGDDGGEFKGGGFNPYSQSPSPVDGFVHPPAYC